MPSALARRRWIHPLTVPSTSKRARIRGFSGSVVLLMILRRGDWGRDWRRVGVTDVCERERKVGVGRIGAVREARRSRSRGHVFIARARKVSVRSAQGSNATTLVVAICTPRGVYLQEAYYVDYIVFQDYLRIHTSIALRTLYAYSRVLTVGALFTFLSRL